MAADLINGEVPLHWEFTTLGDVCRRGGGNIQTGPFGSQLHASDYVPVGVPSIMPTNIGENRIVEDGIVRITECDANRLSQHRLRAGDIVYSRRGDVEKRALIREREEGWLCGTGCLKVRLGTGVVDPLFASLYLGHPSVREWILRHAVGATMPNLNTHIMSAVPFAFPPLAEQRAIAHILGTLDDKIELNRKMNATLEQMARALFKSWFIDFEPVRRNAARTRNQPSPAAARHPLPVGEGWGEGSVEALDRLFPASFQDSPLGPIPKGWEAKTADEVATVGIGKTPPRKEHHWFSENAADVPWMSIRDLGVAGVFISHTSEFLTAEAVEKFRVKRIPDNTVVLSFKLTMGRVAITDGEMLSNEAIAHFCLNPETTFGSVYLYCYLKGFGYDQLGSTSSIATAINSEMVRGIRVLIPPKNITEGFERTIKPLFVQMKTIQKQSHTLAALRDTLLPKLLSGELSPNLRSQ
jgi:type I restriction enzyme S subunit